MDISKIEVTEAETGSLMQVRHPVTGETIEGAGVRLRGMDSKAGRSIQRKRNLRLIQAVAAAKKGEAMESDEDGAEIEELAALTVEFVGLEIDGNPIGSDPELIRQAWARLPWLVDQARNYIYDRANFMQRSNGS